MQNVPLKRLHGACALSLVLYAAGAAPARAATEAPAAAASLSGDPVGTVVASESEGDDEPKKKKKGKKKKKKDDDAEASSDDSSAKSEKKSSSKGASWSVREKKRFVVGAGGGLVIGSIPGFGASAGYHVSPALGLEGSYLTGKEALPGSTDGDAQISQFNISGSLLMARVRYFFFNTFNVTVGLGERQIKAQAAITSQTTADELDMTINLTSIVAGVTIGNQWAWDNGFFLGCDWVGYFQPLSSSSSTTLSASGPNSSTLPGDLSQSVQDSANTLGKAGNDQSLVVTVGWMF